MDVKRIASLANLSLSDKELKKFRSQLEETLIYIKNLSEINTARTEPTSQVTGLENVTREDKVTPSLTQEKALRNAVSTQNGFFKVKGVLRNE